VQRLRVLVNGRNMEAQRTANQEPLVKFGNVAEADCGEKALSGSNGLTPDF